MARSRNYREEYRRRLKKGLARGLSRQAARGHGGSKPATGRQKAPRFDPKLEAALRQLRKPGASVTRVAKEAHVGRERLSQYVKSVAGAHREGKIWRFDDRRVRRLAIVEADQRHPVMVRVAGFEPAHVAGLHYYEASQALSKPRLRTEFVRRWEGVRIQDADGRWHTLSTDIDQLFEAILTQDYSFERFYAIEH